MNTWYSAKRAELAIVGVLLVVICIGYVWFERDRGRVGSPVIVEGGLVSKGVSGGSIATMRVRLREDLAGAFMTQLEGADIDEEQAMALADQTSAYISSLFSEDVSDYVELVESWGGRFWNPETTAEELEDKLTRSVDVYPFVEYGASNATLKDLTYRYEASVDAEVLVLEGTPMGYSRKFHPSFWEFPDFAAQSMDSGDLKESARILRIDVVSANEQEGILELWWLWSDPPGRWAPVSCHYMVDQGYPLPTMVF